MSVQYSLNVKQILYFCAFSSFILYLCSHEVYSITFCYICFFVFLVCFLCLWKYRIKYNYVCFEFVFSLCFFYTNYVYALFYYPVMPYFSLFDLEFPENYINKGIALSTLGYAMLSIGLVNYPFVDKFKNAQLRPVVPNNYRILFFISIGGLIISLIPSLIMGTAFEEASWEKSNFKVIGDCLTYYIVFAIFANSNNLASCFRRNKFVFGLILLYVFILLLCGARGMFLRISIILISCYTVFFKKISLKLIFPTFILGSLLMFYVGSTRGEGNNRTLENEGIPVILNLGQDLIINNRSQYVLMEYADKNGYSYGKTCLGDFLSVIPFGQSTYLTLTNQNIDKINSANLVTTLFFSNSKRESFGLGTNMIGDIYLSFGVVGVVFLMFFLGRVVSKYYYFGMNGSYLQLLNYIILFMSCIVLVRSSFFCYLRPLVWTVLLFKFANSNRTK